MAWQRGSVRHVYAWVVKFTYHCMMEIFKIENEEECLVYSVIQPCSIIDYRMLGDPLRPHDVCVR